MFHLWCQKNGLLCCCNCSKLCFIRYGHLLHKVCTVTPIKIWRPYFWNFNLICRALECFKIFCRRHGNQLIWDESPIFWHWSNFHQLSLAYPKMWYFGKFCLGQMWPIWWLTSKDSLYQLLAICENFLPSDAVNSLTSLIIKDPKNQGFAFGNTPLTQCLN